VNRRVAAVAILMLVCLGWSWALTPTPEAKGREALPPAYAGVAGFAVGRTLVNEHKAVTDNAVWVVPEQWTGVEAMTIPAGGHYVITVQVRLPRGAWAEFRLVRHGWGRDSDGMDETGYHIFLARPDGRRTSDSFTHALIGGGPIDFQIRLHLRQPSTRPLVELPTLICKVHRTD
jgi:hypothetical protein